MPDAAHRVRAHKGRGLFVADDEGSGVVCLVLLVVFWKVIWPYLVGGVVLVGSASGGWWLWRMNRSSKGRDEQWRKEEALKAGHRSVIEVDAMSGERRRSRKAPGGMVT
ncbi:hypothetical protein AQJ67_42155 [Streptomyces caeruleatus]|uniref:Uncharacterized protein n=1 Tax=Streptomyces caeruleatus TaxID=661399 RepID=A0A117RHQ3_9ACTN|nr:hypothetical protein AQJ67_42155 [Streptomyces caeruleatus]